MRPLTRLLFTLVLAGTVASIPALAADDETEPGYDSESLYIVLLDTTSATGMSADEFNRYERQFRLAFEKHRWPTPLKFERDGFEGPPDSVELILQLQGISEEVPGEIRFRTWATISYDGGKRELGIVTARVNPKFGARGADILDQLLFAAGEAILEKLEEAGLALN